MSIKYKHYNKKSVKITVYLKMTTIQNIYKNDKSNQILKVYTFLRTFNKVQNKTISKFIMITLTNIFPLMKLNSKLKKMNSINYWNLNNFKKIKIKIIN